MRARVFEAGPVGLIETAHLLDVEFGGEVAIGTDTHAISVLVAGKTTVDWYVEGSALSGTMTAGAVSLAPRSPSHRFRFGGRSRSLRLSLRDDILEMLGEEFEGARLPALVPPLLGPQRPRLAQGARVLSRALAAGAPVEPLLLDGVEATLCEEMGQLLLAGSPVPSLADARRNIATSGVLEYIEENIGNRLRLDALAALAGLRRTHFAREFRRLTGRSPHAYVTARRIARAKPLLADPRIPLADIAYMLGFSSQSHFSSAFAAATGTTPSAFRRAAR